MMTPLTSHQRPAAPVMRNSRVNERSAPSTIERSARASLGRASGSTRSSTDPSAAPASFAKAALLRRMVPSATTLHIPIGLSSNMMRTV